MDSWRAYRNYRFIWAANFFGNTALWLQLLTLGWLVKFLSEDGANSALLVVGVGGTAALPGVFIGPWGGVIGDRLDRRKLIICIEIFMAFFALSFALLVKLDMVEIWHAFFYAFVCTISSVIGGIVGYCIGYFFYNSLGLMIINYSEKLVRSDK